MGGIGVNAVCGRRNIFAFIGSFWFGNGRLIGTRCAVRPLWAKSKTEAEWKGASAQRAATAAFDWESRFADAHLCLLADEGYPALLSEGLTPPPLLFVRGQIACLQQPAIAIVGSRHATPQAMRIARDFARVLAEHGVVVVSGMADGIDRAAHEGALQGGGHTVAVWGTGIDRVYPSRNKKLAGEIVQHGCVVSEFPLGTRPLAGHFPRRNRLIAGLAVATLVVEAATESGSLITARLAAEMGREVMAVPGSIDNPLSKGCHALIKQGAKLVENLDDILQECPSLLQNGFMQPFGVVNTNHTNEDARSRLSDGARGDGSSTDNAQYVLQQMGFDAVHPDELVTMLGMTAADVYAEIVALELAGWVQALPGGRFQRIKS